MKAAIYTENKEFEYTRIYEPELKDGGAIIKVKGCGLCGSDIVKLRHGFTKPGSVLGHEVVGLIDKIGENKNFKQGDRVVLGHHVPCFDCVFCNNENYSMCREFKNSNIVPGGFCEYIYASKRHLENTVFKVPESISDIQVSFVEPAACCLRAVKRMAVKQNDVVLVIGLGSIGLIAGQILKHYGTRVIGCDLLDERLEFAEKFGFDSVYKYTTDEEISELIKSKFRKEGADKIFLASGSNKSLPLAVLAVRDGGKILVFSSVTFDDIGFSNNDIYYRELTVLGSYSPSPQDLADSLNLLKDNIIEVDGLSVVYELKDINKAIEDTCSNKIMKAYINIEQNS